MLIGLVSGSSWRILECRWLPSGPPASTAGPREGEGPAGRFPFPPKQALESDLQHQAADADKPFVVDAVRRGDQAVLHRHGFELVDAVRVHHLRRVVGELSLADEFYVLVQLVADRREGD